MRGVATESRAVAIDRTPLGRALAAIRFHGFLLDLDLRLSVRPDTVIYVRAW